MVRRTNMSHDPIVDEIRRIREAYAAKFNFDLEAIFKDLREKQARSGRPVVRLPANRVSADQNRTENPAA